MIQVMVTSPSMTGGTPHPPWVFFVVCQMNVLKNAQPNDDGLSDNKMKVRTSGLMTREIELNQNFV